MQVRLSSKVGMKIAYEAFHSVVWIIRKGSLDEGLLTWGLWNPKEFVNVIWRVIRLCSDISKQYIGFADI